MPRPSTIETHPQRADIESALLQGISYRDIAGRYGLSKSAVERYSDKLTSTLAKAQEAQEVANGDRLLAQVIDLQKQALEILEATKQGKDYRTSLSAIAQARACLELQAKLLGELQENTVVNVLVSPAWITVRTVLLQALEPYPEARVAVARALEALNAG